MEETENNAWMNYITLASPCLEEIIVSVKYLTSWSSAELSPPLICTPCFCSSNLMTGYWVGSACRVIPRTTIAPEVSDEGTWMWPGDAAN